VKNLVIISGITGAIGSALLAEYLKKQNTFVYGISRKAQALQSLLVDEKLPLSTLICSIGEASQQAVKTFVDHIDWKNIRSVTYIHAIGHYPFEVDIKGNFVVENDKDSDGINDMCLFLTYTLFKLFILNIKSHFSKKFTAVVFGGIADKYKPKAHTSWWTVMQKTKDWMIENKAVAQFRVLNISSVICPHEIITRPFVFSGTDANPKFWLKPCEVAKEVLLMNSAYTKDKDFIEENFYHRLPGFNESYYDNKFFTPRKVSELYRS